MGVTSSDGARGSICGSGGRKCFDCTQRYDTNPENVHFDSEGPRDE